MKIAMTGGTGFVGARLIETAAGRDLTIRALTRRPMRSRVGVEWVMGSLEDEQSLRDLVAGADSVIHVAGVLKGRRAEDFERCNVEGTRSLAAVAAAAGVRRFVQVSSLAAREPTLSLYGASKAKAEDVVRESGLPFAIVRPPAVYGPGDRETLELFRMAKRGLMLMPPPGRISLLHADDLAALLLNLASEGAGEGTIIEPDDAHPGGWSHRAFAEALGEAVGTRPRTVHAPAFLLHAAAGIDQLIRRSNAKLTRDRAAYFAHPDWVVSAAHAPPPELWRPAIETKRGLRETAEWYRAQGWL